MVAMDRPSSAADELSRPATDRCLLRVSCGPKRAPRIRLLSANTDFHKLPRLGPRGRELGEPLFDGRDPAGLSGSQFSFAVELPQDFERAG